MNRHPKKTRRQRPVKHGRTALPSCVVKEIEAAVLYIAKHEGVSKSWVVATALADFFGISIERYDGRETKRRLRRVG